MRGRKARVLVAALVVALCAGTSSALAQGNDYKALTNAAVEELSSGHYEEARALFARAHAINPSARTFWGMGVAAFEARQYVDAIQLLTQSRDDARKPLTAEQRKQTESLLERSQAFVVRVPIRVEPAAAKVTIDGREVERDKDGVALLDAGTHQVVVSAAGHQEVVRVARWEVGDAPLFEVHLEPKGASGPAAGSDSDAAHTQAPGPAPSSAAASERSAFAVLKWVSLGATVAALGIMGTGLAMREKEASHYNDDTKCPPPDRDAECPDSREAVQRLKRTAIAGGASAGIFATLTVVSFLLDRKPTRHAAARTQCGPAFEGGALCQVRF
jgi:tetratricopeptide (TPR) repeat protein